MSKLWLKSLLVTPAILGATLTLGSVAKAADPLATTEFPAVDVNQLAQVSEPTSLDQLEQYSGEGQVNATEEQVTSVNQLRDVSPTDWAYEALKSLVENYGCIVGYPDRTFRGNRAMTRWEFAAGLNACMNYMERLIQNGVAVAKEDIDKLRKLMEDYQAELAALGARVDNLEARVSFLEDHQFSTTTKLSGEVIFAVTDVFGEENGDIQTVFQDRVRLTFNTSFTGTDRLATRLAAGNAQPFGLNYNTGVIDKDGNTQGASFDNLQSPTLRQTFNLSPNYNNSVGIDWLAYYTSLGPATVYVAGWGGAWYDIAPTNNPYFEDYDGGNGALSTFAQDNPIYRIGGGAGGGINLAFGSKDSFLGNSSLTLGYLSGTANNPDPGAGVFNGDYAALAQLNVNLGNAVSLGLTYVNSYQGADSGLFGNTVGTDLANFSQSSLSDSFNSSVAPDDYFDGRTPFDFRQKLASSYGASMAVKLSDAVSFSAFGTYSQVRLLGRGDAEVWSFGGGFAFPDFLKEGSVLGLFAGVPPYVSNLDAPNVVEYSNDMPIHVEVFYKYQVTDNISLTPGFIWVQNPTQVTGSDNDSVFIGTLRGTFRF